MFFFGLASNIITLGVLGVFSLVFLYQGLQIKVLQVNEEKSIEFKESANTLSSIDLVDVDYALIEDATIFVKPQFIPAQSFCCYPKITKELCYILECRGPPFV